MHSTFPCLKPLVFPNKPRNKINKQRNKLETNWEQYKIYQQQPNGLWLHLDEIKVAEASSSAATAKDASDALQTHLSNINSAVEALHQEVRHLQQEVKVLREARSEIIAAVSLLKDVVPAGMQALPSTPTPSSPKICYFADKIEDETWKELSEDLAKKERIFRYHNEEKLEQKQNPFQRIQNAA